MILHGNKGEWGELYIFFKILIDGKIYAADADYNRIDNLFLNIISLIREEVKGYKYKYYTGDNIRIRLNGKDILTLPRQVFVEQAIHIWTKMNNAGETTFTVNEINEFLDKIHITKLKSPSQKTSDHFGGTIDILVEAVTKDNVERVLGFSCKTDLTSASTLFNASGDNTNFLYELCGAIDDEVMHTFNNLYNKKKGISVVERMKYLKRCGISLKFVRPVTDTTMENLTVSGGIEMPLIVGEMLKHFYYDNSGGKTFVQESVDYVTKANVANYPFQDLANIYHIKVSNLIFNMFTGMHFGKKWNGKAEVNGGYIVLKRDGEVVAYHSTIADEFKDFLLSKLRFESPSHKRHKDMIIEKVNGRYYLKLALQLRFASQT